jgi:hypothetical protein
MCIFRKGHPQASAFLSDTEMYKMYFFSQEYVHQPIAQNIRRANNLWMTLFHVLAMKDIIMMEQYV